MTILAQWDGEGFVPYGRYAKRCDADYVVGQVYAIDAVLERSSQTHKGNLQAADIIAYRALSPSVEVGKQDFVQKEEPS